MSNRLVKGAFAALFFCGALSVGLVGQAGSTPVLQAALEAELDRAMSGLKLPDQPAPYWIQT